MTITSQSTAFKTTLLIASLSTLLTACGGGGGGSSSSSTNDNPTTPTANQPSASAVAQQVLATLNTKRVQCGFGSLANNIELEKAASNHNNYLGSISTQNKLTYGSHNEGTVTNLIGTGTANPYFTGYAASNRIKTDANKGQLAQPVSYEAEAGMVAENLSLSTLTTVNNSVDANTTSQTMLTSLLAAPYHMRGLVSPSLTQVGINYQQYEWQNTNNKNIMSLLEIVSALPAGQAQTTNSTLLTYPCDGIVGTEYELTNESPNPIPSRDLEANPIGQPVYILAPSDKTISSVNATLAIQGVSASNLTILTQATDPNKQLKANEAFILPENSLKPATTYTVNYTVTYTTGESVAKTFNFTTKA